MNFWIVADTHFGHNMLWREGHRKIDFEERLLMNINNAYKEGDVLIHLGDVSFYDHVRWHQRLMKSWPGKRWLIIGNHDDKSINWYLQQGWDVACYEFAIMMYSYLIVFTHEPTIDCKDGSVINIHGHLHTGVHRETETSKRNILVSMEETDMKPIALKSIIENYQ